MNDDLISRHELCEYSLNQKDKSVTPNDIMRFPSARTEQQHGRIFQEIVVEYLSYNIYPEYKGKPYFSIKYTENGQEFIGYGTYKPEVLSEYLKEYFMPSAQPDIIRCKECKYGDTFHEFDDPEMPMKCIGHHYGGTYPDDFCSYAERREYENT